VNFSRILRNFGIRCTPQEVIDASRGVLALNPRDPEELREILRLTLVKDPEHYSTFDKLFNWYWLGGEEPRLMVQSRAMVKVIAESKDALDPVGRFMSIYSPVEVRGRAVREKLRGGSDVRVVRRMVKALARATAQTPGVRRVEGKEYVDFPRTFSTAISTLGEIVRLRRSSRKRTRARLVVLLDVSGSMEERWGSLMRILQGLRQLPQGTYEAFVFSTSLVRITDILASSSVRALEDELIRVVDIWGSGTRIGECLMEFMDKQGGLLRGDSTVIVVSDGWDLGDLGVLEESLRRMRRSAGRIIWLDPNASMRNYSPETACMRIVIRYVDAVLPIDVLMDQKYLRNMVRLVKGRNT